MSPADSDCHSGAPYSLRIGVPDCLPGKPFSKTIDTPDIASLIPLIERIA
jgi:hypothetical protein